MDLIKNLFMKLMKDMKDMKDPFIKDLPVKDLLMKDLPMKGLLMRKLPACLAAALLAAALAAGHARAAEAGASAGTVLAAAEDAELHEEASGGSRVSAVLEAGMYVIVTGEGAGGWLPVSSGEASGWVRARSLGLPGGAEEDAEFAQAGENGRTAFDEMEQMRRGKAQARAWGAALALLMAGIFAAGLAPVLKKGRGSRKGGGGDAGSGKDSAGAG